MVLAGETAAAEEQFASADHVWHTDGPDGSHLSWVGTAWWEAFLARTGRADSARRMTDLSRAICAERGWNADVARCDRLLGQLDLLRADTAAATSRLAAATKTFRAGDDFVELADTLPVLAECARLNGGLDAAERHATEAIAIAAPGSCAPHRPPH